MSQIIKLTYIFCSFIRDLKNIIEMISMYYYRELLTPQQHYDWGLRALKTILKGCGTLLKNFKKNLKEEGM